MNIAIQRINEWIQNNNDNAILNLSGLGLTKLPTLPNNLKDLDCSSNKLTSLPPRLPDTLCKLNCRCNKLTSLPILPDLEELICNFNKLNLPKNCLVYNKSKYRCNHNVIEIINKFKYIELENKQLKQEIKQLKLLKSLSLEGTLSYTIKKYI